MIIERLKAKVATWIQRRPVRYQSAQVTLLGKKITIADSPSYAFMYSEIFEKELFKFKADSDAPFIIDAGANIGLATIYFKKLYPNARLIAFEPDPRIFRLLETNIGTFNFSNVTLINKALSKQESYVSFHTEGADAGRIIKDQGSSSSNGVIQVPAVRLCQYINQKVDFLKLDIEGAEIDVLYDIDNKLEQVDKLFVEYHSFTNEPQRLHELITLLANHGFRIYITAPGLSSDNPFINIRTYLDMDMQLNIYAIRV